MKTKLLFLIFIWGSWIAFFFTLINSEKVDEDSIHHDFGTVKEASCITSRSINGLRLLILRDNGQLIEEFVSLPGNYQCDADLVFRFRGDYIHFSKYRNYFLALNIGNTVILDMQSEIDKVNNSAGLINFSLFLAFVMSLLVLIKKSKA